MATCQNIPSAGSAYRFTACAIPPGHLRRWLIRAEFDGERAGSVVAKPQGASEIEISSIEVEPEHRRNRLGTRLYERALVWGCGQPGVLAITSDTVRSPFAEAFWRKQQAKGRAKCVGTGGDEYPDPIEELRARVREGTLSRAEFDRMVAPLPKAVRGRWPCERFVIDCASRPSSLDGVRRRKKRTKR